MEDNKSVITMENKVSEILENILGLLGLEGSFEVSENPEQVDVIIETEDAGRLIGYRGETLDSLQLLINQIVNKSNNKEEDTFKRVVIDVSNWRKNREEDLKNQAAKWAEEVINSGEQIELEPQPAWQRRVVHMIVEGIEGVESESMGEGKDRHLVIRPTIKKETSEKAPKKAAKKSKLEPTEESS